ncbi:hypothetical protein PISMIDRAFT_678286 [Pisolithus microcarpus 441]|uniref:DUF6534 domain-containing protein n=1 Tax=Pisolithus microcarpus 441 TaxID=765257 RepID=A0A0C9YHF8_9AGAM|nr:hypothetical protein BKA83DRAFT_678286 [Pisolithus microcarpus]KIK24420.1 hypothetical protein PISMIDRAFT_678286 [Pisolithus microcarpus 441]
MVYGITTLQTYVYYMHYSEDSLILKLLVAAVWVLDTVHVSFMIHALYYYLIATYGVPTSLEYIIWTLPGSDLMNVFIVFGVQCFFAHQIYCLCRPQVRWWVTAPIMVLVLAQLGFGAESDIMEIIHHDASIVPQILYYGVTPAVATIALAEIMITVSLCVLLYDRGSSSPIARTKRLLNTLIIYAINRCLLTSVVVIVDLVTAVDINVDIWSMGLSFIVGKLYANSLLASLNSREHLRSKSADSVSDPRNGTVHFANLTKFVGEAESSADGTRSSDVSEVIANNASTAFALEKTAASRTEGEV